MSYSRHSSHSAFYGQDLSLMDHRPDWLRLAEKAEEVNRKSLGPASIADLGHTSGAAAAARWVMESQSLKVSDSVVRRIEAERALAASYAPAANLLREPDWATAARISRGLDEASTARRFLDEERLSHQARHAASMYRNKAEEMAAKAAILPRQLLDIADQIAGMRLPDVLRDYQQSRDYLALRMAAVGDTPIWAESRSHQAAFGRNLAFSEMLRQARGIGSTEIEAMRELTSRPVPMFETPAQCRSFLAGAGLVAPRGVRLRPPSAPEKIGAYQAILIKFERPDFAIRSRNRIIQRQDALCFIIEMLMTRRYGPNWAEERLPECKCGGLLGKWRSKGGLAMNHADLADCIKIMTHPEHFQLMFEGAFDDAASAEFVLDRLRDFRGMLCHDRGPGGEFTMEHYQETHILISTLDQALGSINDIDLEYYN